MKLHQKGFLLVEFSKVGSIWDYELVGKAMNEYNLAGPYWTNAICVALDELAAAGLITRLESRLDDGTQIASGRVLFNYRLSEFGRGRMRDTGLLPAHGELA
jgi:hypothetical protein